MFLVVEKYFPALVGRGELTNVHDGSFMTSAVQVTVDTNRWLEVVG